MSPGSTSRRHGNLRPADVPDRGVVGAGTGTCGRFISPMFCELRDCVDARVPVWTFQPHKPVRGRSSSRDAQTEFLTGSGVSRSGGDRPGDRPDGGARGGRPRHGRARSPRPDRRQRGLSSCPGGCRPGSRWRPTSRDSVQSRGARTRGVRICRRDAGVAARLEEPQRPRGRHVLTSMNGRSAMKTRSRRGDHRAGIDRSLGRPDAGGLGCRWKEHRRVVDCSCDTRVDHPRHRRPAALRQLWHQHQRPADRQLQHRRAGPVRRLDQAR